MAGGGRYGGSIGAGDVGSDWGDQELWRVWAGVCRLGWRRRDDDLRKVTTAMTARKALLWFPRLVRDICAFRVELWSDFTPFIKG